MSIKKLKEMFNEVTIKKNANLIPAYYHREFQLYTNQKVMDYEHFLQSHYEYYATPIQYQVEYDDETLIEQGDKIAGRVWITTRKPNESDKRIEVILIAQYREEKLYRLWELTFPDWTALPEFIS